MLAYVTVARPAIILFENVEDIADPDSSTGCSNLDVVLAEFSPRGYACQQMTGNAAAYGVPQRRVRLYLVAVLVVANSQFNFLQNSVCNTFRTLRALLKVCARSPPCASAVIYKASDHRVRNILQLRREARANSKPGNFSIGSAITTAGLNGVSWSSIQAPEVLKSSSWFPTLTLQQKLTAAYSLCTDTTPVLFRDISQSLSRVRTSTIGEDGEHSIFTVTPGQMVIVFKDGEEPRLLLGEESMLLQGFPIAAVSDLVQKTPNSVMADLAGNMVAVPVLLALLMSSVACVHWRANDADEEGQQQASSDESSESSSSGLDVATSVLAILAQNDQTGSNTLGDTPVRKRVKFE